MTKRKRVTVDQAELLGLLDHVESLVRFCSTHMPDVARYDAGAAALWTVVHRIAGNDTIADKLARKVPTKVR